MWVERVMGGKKKVVRMKWSLKNNCIPLWNVCALAKLQRCRKANSMKMWRRRWIWLYGWAKKECFHPGFSPTFSSNTCNVTWTFLIALTLPAPIKGIWNQVNKWNTNCHCVQNNWLQKILVSRGFINKTGLAALLENIGVEDDWYEKHHRWACLTMTQLTVRKESK